MGKKMLQKQKKWGANDETIKTNREKLGIQKDMLVLLLVNKINTVDGRTVNPQLTVFKMILMLLKKKQEM